MRHLAIVLSLAAVATASAQNTENWAQFLGPQSMARASGASTLSFDREQDLIYRVALPPGESSPCIWGDQIFLTGYEQDQLVMFALDRKTGEEQWRHGVPIPEDSKFLHTDVGIAMPTACTNGKRVFFYLASYGLLARELDGSLAWEKRLPHSALNYGMGSSPIIYEDIVFLLRDGCADAALYALDEESGEEVWTMPRLNFGTSHSTPFIWENRERTELIVASTGTVMSIDPWSGTELWRVEGLTPLVCTTPTASADRLYFAGWSTPAALGAIRVTDGMEEVVELTEEERNDPEALFRRFDDNDDGKLGPEEIPSGRVKASLALMDRNGDVALQEWLGLFQFPVTGKNLLVAIKPGGKGNVTDTHVEWSVRRGIPYVASPLLYEGRLYLVKAGGIVSCIDAATGNTIFGRSRLDDNSEYYATPLGVDGHVVICSSAGSLYVLEIADELKILRSVEFEERIFATPAVAGGTIYLRTAEALYAFGRNK